MAKETLKIGDKVRCIREPADKSWKLYVRRAYRINNVRPNGSLFDFQIAGHDICETIWWNDDRFEKVKPNRK